jgi:hypothetical protein
MFTQLFIETTNPKLSWSQFVSIRIMSIILLSIIFHTLIYTIFFNLGSFIFYGKILSNQINIRLIISLLIIMFFGYIGRFIHCKQIYNDFNKNEVKTNEYINTHYNSWVFLG